MYLRSQPAALRRLWCTPGPNHPGRPIMSAATGDVPAQQAYDDRWKDIWNKGLDPGQGFDLGRTTPILSHLLDTGKLGVGGKRVLVPGCGRGYDVTALAEAAPSPSVVYGLDLAETAIAEGKKLLEEAKDGCPAKALARFEVANFFTWHPEEGGKFDVGWDYTFGCAMHPSVRTQWAANWARLMAPGAALVTLIFPIVPSADPNVGPPFPVSLELYESLLQPAGFELVETMQVDDLSVPPRKGKELIGIWRRVVEE